MKETLNDLSLQRAGSSTGLLEYQLQINVLESQIKDLNEEHGNLVKENQEKRDLINQLKQQINGINSEIGDLTSAISKQEVTNINLNNSNGDKRRIDAPRELANLNRIRTELSDIESQVKEKQKEQAALEKDLENIQDRHKELKEEIIPSLTRTLNNLKRDFAWQQEMNKNYVTVFSKMVNEVWEKTTKKTIWALDTYFDILSRFNIETQKNLSISNFKLRERSESKERVSVGKFKIVVDDLTIQTGIQNLQIINLDLDIDFIYPESRPHKIEGNKLVEIGYRKNFYKMELTVVRKDFKEEKI
ncbi:hypothetical protein NX779_03465 [Mycoplasma cottewii]|uniref:Uncharacterized protein n=1 Tax=Mycoplasma cottewii TaxID=51364 RepID=A0ABY5TVY3_9MOLU|nr:hypothetical protein [Mycoplasma cottewii]UWD34843.1 hypothetical protein NX779_03465 [Mycoplasma cottewii]